MPVSGQERADSGGWVIFLMEGDDLNPDVITELLGISPDRTAYPDPQDGSRGFWQLNSTLSGSRPAEEHYWNILERLLPVYRKLWDLSEKYALEFYCSLRKGSDERSALNLPAKILLLTGYIGARLEFEAYE